MATKIENEKIGLGEKKKKRKGIPIRNSGRSSKRQSAPKTAMEKLA